MFGGDYEVKALLYQGFDAAQRSPGAPVIYPVAPSPQTFLNLVGMTLFPKYGVAASRRTKSTTINLRRDYRSRLESGELGGTKVSIKRWTI